MKLQTFVFVALLVVLSIFTTLYWVKPRKIVIEVPVDVFPDTVYIDQTPVPPDTVYRVRVRVERDTITETIHIIEEAPAEEILLTEFDFVEAFEAGDATDMLMYRKTFTNALLDNRLTVKSVVDAYTVEPSKVYFLDNNLSLDFDRDALYKDWLDALPKTKSKFGTGVLVGAGATLGLITIGFLTGVF